MKSYLITGATSGIGLETALSLSKNNDSKLILVGRKVDELKRIFASNQNVFVEQLDVTDTREMDAFVSRIEPVDGVVFSAGVLEYVPLKVISQKHIDYVFNVNYMSPVLMTQKLISLKKINKSGSLVYLSSIASESGVAGTAVYAASKAAIKASAKVFANELSIRKIRVNTISPGLINTPMLKEEEKYKEINDLYPLGIGMPNNIADMIMFLLSDNATWVTGSDFIIDGGASLRKY